MYARITLAAGVVCIAVLATANIASKSKPVLASNQAEFARTDAQKNDTSREVTASAPVIGQERLAGLDASTPSPIVNFQSRLSRIAQIKDSVARQAELGQLLQRWVAVDVNEALREAPRIVPAEMRDTVLREVVQAWAVRDPEGAAHWALSLPEPVEQNRMLDQIFAKIAETSPERAAELLQDHLDIAQPALVENVVQQWANTDLRSAYDWVDAQTDGNLRAELIQRIAFEWSKTDPVQAAQFAVNQIPAGPVQEEAVVSVIHQWAMKDLAGANAWAQAFPQGNLRNRVLDEVSGVAKVRVSTRGM